MKQKGFTLVELLIVVLIIGILAAIALPLYQKVVWRGRNARLKYYVKVIADTQQIYYLTHGRYAADFNSLDVKLPLASPGTHADTQLYPCEGLVPGEDSVRLGDNFVVFFNNASSSLTTTLTVVARYIKGPYQCEGIRSTVTQGGYRLNREFYCLENPSLKEEGSFCEKLEHGKFIETDQWGNRYYTLM